MNFNFLDISIITFLILSIITGYFRGFTKRFLSFLGSLLALAGAYFLSKPVSLLMTFKINITTNIPVENIQSITPFIYRAIAFAVILVGLLIVKSIVLMVIKPVVKTIIDTFKLTGTLDSLLGAGLSFIKGMIFVYITLLLMCLPVNQNKFAMVNDSIVANKILNLVPDVYNQIKGMNQFDNLVSMVKNNKLSVDSFDINKLKELDEQTLNSTHQLAKTAISFGIISEKEINQYSIQAKTKVEAMNEKVTISQMQKNEIDKILDLPGVDEGLKTAVNNKINIK